MKGQRFRRAVGVVTATVLLGAAAATATSLSDPDGYEATSRVVHTDPAGARETLARGAALARDALDRAGAVRTPVAALRRNSEVETEGGDTVVFTVRAGRPEAATRVATAYARAYVSALPPSERATARVTGAGEAQRARRPARAAAVGAGIGLLAGLLLALALGVIAARRVRDRADEPETAADAEKDDEGRDDARVATPAGANGDLPPRDIAEVAHDFENVTEAAVGAAIIDLHCHILPGIDDGPRTFAHSVELGRAIAAGGVDIVAATPHLRADHPGVVPRELAGRCADLQDRLDGEGVPLEVVPGGELDLRWALSASDEDLRLVSYGQRGTDLLVETPYGKLRASFEEELYELTVRGFRILLAHPERSRTFQQRPERLAELVGRGTLVQITAESLVRSPRRSRSGRLARRLVRDGLAHVLASDSHAALGWMRAPIGAAIDAVEQLQEARGTWMASTAPAAVLSGDSLQPPSDVEQAGRKPGRDRLNR